MWALGKPRTRSFVIHKFTTLLSILFVCFNLKANEVKVNVENTADGYIIHTDAPSGMTSEASLNDKSIKEALFTFALTELKGSEDWPAGANFSFFDGEQKNSIHIAFLIDKAINDNVIIATKIVENEKLTGAGNFPIEVANLEQVAVRFKWENKKICMQFNSNDEVEIISLPYEVNNLKFGLQSSAGKINVSLPNKALKQDKNSLLFFVPQTF
jgi:hypothetical protein